jgi:thioredoxin reductase (NADPH)
MIRKTVIIGGGCAGLTAGLYLGRAELKPLLFAGDYEDKGGLLVKTSIVENFPGFPDGVLGYDFMTGLEQQAIKYDCEVVNSEVTDVDFSSKPMTITDSDGIKYQTETIVIATGSKPNKLGLDNEDKFWSKGISSCAVCDGALFKGKKIMVVGGGDSAMEEAQFLTKFGRVTLVHRRDEFRASKAMINKVITNDKITVIYNSVITRLHGSDHLESVTIHNLVHGFYVDLPVDGLFYGLGLTPNTKLFKGKLDIDSDGYIVKTHDPEYETMTSVPGVFVAGDANDKVYRQAVVASADGCKAALDVNKYLSIVTE